MAQFPKDENSTVALAQLVNSGIKNNNSTFPNPPASLSGLPTDLEEYAVKIAQIQSADAQKRLLVQEKNVVYKRLRGATRDGIDYAELIAQGNPAILALVSWSNPADPVALLPPGQARYFEIIGQGEGYVRFDWKEPLDGGSVAAYNIMRSEDGENYEIAGTFTASDGAVFDQPRGKKLFYYVVAINRAGDSVPSNSVSLVL